MVVFLQSRILARDDTPWDKNQTLQDRLQIGLFSQKRAMSIQDYESYSLRFGDLDQSATFDF